LVRVYYDKDIDDSLIHKTTVAVIGYGIQGRAQALNLRDSGVEVLVGLREGGNSWKLAKSDGFQPVTVSHASSKASLIMMLIPDPKQPEVFKSEIQPNLKSGKALNFAHGYNIHFKDIVPPKDVDVIMVAPKSPGQRLRELYVNGFGAPALFAVEHDSTGHARELVLALCKALGCSRAGVIETTFKEMKLIMDLVYQYGFVGMLRRVSDTAKFGGLTVGPKVIDKNVRKNMTRILKDIQNGKFAKSWTGDREKTAKQLDAMIKEFEKHPIEKVGKDIRKLSGLEK
jgi:ketol-acid reductoisomerase